MQPMGRGGGARSGGGASADWWEPRGRGESAGLRLIDRAGHGCGALRPAASHCWGGPRVPSPLQLWVPARSPRSPARGCLLSALARSLAHGLCISSSSRPSSARRLRPPRCLCAPPPPPSARDAPVTAAVAAALGRWPERKKRRKRGAPPGPCRSQRPGPAAAPAPSPERTRPAWTGMGVRAAPSCAAAPAAAGAEQGRRPWLWPPSPPPPLLLLLLLSLGLFHAGRRRPGGERAARALFWVPGGRAVGQASTVLPVAGSRLCLAPRRPSGSRLPPRAGQTLLDFIALRRGIDWSPLRIGFPPPASRDWSPVLLLLYSWGWRSGRESHPVQKKKKKTQAFFSLSRVWVEFLRNLS